MKPYQAYLESEKLGKRIPKLEPVISKDAEYSFWYALYVIKGEFIIGEPFISKDAYYSYRYAKEVIKGRWEQGEPIISKDAQYSFYYAKDVIKGRLPDFMHNTLILSNDESAKEYVELIQ